jgi:hypothetical protein
MSPRSANPSYLPELPPAAFERAQRQIARTRTFEGPQLVAEYERLMFETLLRMAKERQESRNGGGDSAK